MPTSQYKSASNDGAFSGEVWIAGYLDPCHDFPKKGVTFQWFGPLLRSPSAFKRAIECFYTRYSSLQVDTIVGIDSRGFIFGAALAYRLGVPFVLARKVGKLPGETFRCRYDLEYGSDELQVEKKAVEGLGRVVLIDDVIASGGTMLAAANLMQQAGVGVVEACSLIGLPSLGGFEKLSKKQISTYSLLCIDPL